MLELANDPSVTPGALGFSFPVADSRHDAWMQDQPHRERWVIEEMSTNTPVGLTGLNDLDWQSRKALTFVKLSPTAQGRGLAYDAIMTVNAYSFDMVGLNRLYGAMLAVNSPSLGVYQKAGWTIEGRERQSAFRFGEFIDVVTVAILREDFDAHLDRDRYRITNPAHLRGHEGEGGE